MASETKKVVWVLQGARAGDNAQAAELAARLDAAVVLQPLDFTARHLLPNWLLGASLSHLTPESAARLQPPWPDLVIATGKRTAPVSLWIKAQSGGRSKTVHLGRPRAPLAGFDLVISTPQYGLPRDGNVVELPLPFATPRAVPEQVVAQWRDAWRDLPRPLTAVAIGQGKFPLRFGPAEIATLARLLNDDVARHGGSLLLLASPRTGATVVATLARALRVPHVAFERFERDRNPYPAALLLADRFVVTSDSVSMLSEALNTGKPVSAYRLPVARGHFSWSGERGVMAALARQGVLMPPRNVPAIVDSLVASGVLGVLGEAPPRAPYRRSDVEALARVKALLT
jgi:mitochondrial fission protein ELM1